MDEPDPDSDEIPVSHNSSLPFRRVESDVVKTSEELTPKSPFTSNSLLLRLPSASVVLL